MISQARLSSCEKEEADANRKNDQMMPTTSHDISLSHASFHTRQQDTSREPSVHQLLRQDRQYYGLASTVLHVNMSRLASPSRIGKQVNSQSQPYQEVAIERDGFPARPYVRISGVSTLRKE